MERDDFKILDELTELEVENFFDDDYIDVFSWTEGEGRGTSNYNIYKKDKTYIIGSQHFSFDDYNQEKYNFITITKTITK
jgi:hypothetical protein